MRDGEVYYDKQDDRIIFVLQWDRYSLPILLERLQDGRINVFHSDEFDNRQWHSPLIKIA